MKNVSIDNGNTFTTVKEAVENMDWETIVNLMDDETRERAADEFAPCTNEEFLKSYLELAEEDLIIG